MNKEQLINLRNMLLTKDEEYININKDRNGYLLGDIQRFSEIQKELDTEGAVKAIISNFENAIYHFCKEQRSFDTMTITPCMCPYIRKKALDKYFNVEEAIANDEYFLESEIFLQDDIQLLDDIVDIDLYRLFVSKNKKTISNIGDTEYIPKYNAINWFVVSLKDLKNALFSEGLELKGVDEVKDVLTNNYKGSITIEFEKAKTKTKIQKNNNKKV